MLANLFILQLALVPVTKLSVLNRILVPLKCTLNWIKRGGLGGLLQTRRSVTSTYNTDGLLIFCSICFLFFNVIKFVIITKTSRKLTPEAPAYEKSWLKQTFRPTNLMAILVSINSALKNINMILFWYR